MRHPSKLTIRSDLSKLRDTAKKLKNTPWKKTRVNHSGGGIRIPWADNELSCIPKHTWVKYESYSLAKTNQKWLRTKEKDWGVIMTIIKVRICWAKISPQWLRRLKTLSCYHVIYKLSCYGEYVVCHGLCLHFALVLLKHIRCCSTEVVFTFF